MPRSFPASSAGGSRSCPRQHSSSTSHALQAGGAGGRSGRAVKGTGRSQGSRGTEDISGAGSLQIHAGGGASKHVRKLPLCSALLRARGEGRSVPKSLLRRAPRKPHGAATVPTPPRCRSPKPPAPSGKGILASTTCRGPRSSRSDLPLRGAGLEEGDGDKQAQRGCSAHPRAKD